MERRVFFKAFCGAIAAVVSAPVVAMLPAAVKKQPGKMYAEVTLSNNNSVPLGYFSREEIHRAFGVGECQINLGETPFAYDLPPGHCGWVTGIKFDPSR